MRGLLNDLLEAVWPKRWLVVTDVNGVMLITSTHHTKADAVMQLQPVLDNRVVHVDELAAGAIYFRGE